MGSALRIQPRMDGNIKKKKKFQKVEFATQATIYSIYIVFYNYLHSIYTVLAIISNLEWLKVYRRMCVGYMQRRHHFI